MDFSSLTFEEVSRHFDRRRALNRVSFSCESGQIVALLGANGAGKSTLLSIASTMLSPSSGRVLYGSRTAGEHGDSLRARIGLLGHDLYLYPELTAAENLSFFAQLYGVDRTDARVAAALRMSGLADRAREPVSSFSRGMRQRLAFERALLHSPRLLLLDEPFTGLDDAAAAALRERLMDGKRDGAMTLLTSHDLESIEGLVDDAYVLTAGRLEPLRGRAGTLRQRYREHAVS